MGTTPQNRSCHDTEEGESCYRAVTWAMEHGIVVHPEWYPGLHVGSTFAEFQAHMNTIGHGGCEDPCDICQTSTPGEQCYEAVTWAMQHGIQLHPDWSIYSGLDADSSFVDVQAALHRHQSNRCPEPCGLCRTAVEGEPCYEGVMWLMEYGISLHPEWYPKLTTNSSFE